MGRLGVRAHKGKLSHIAKDMALPLSRFETVNYTKVVAEYNTQSSSSQRLVDPFCCCAPLISVNSEQTTVQLKSQSTYYYQRTPVLSILLLDPIDSSFL